MSEFQRFFEHFKTAPQWAQMVQTVEASPWHREANTAVHTEMVLAEYERQFAPHRTEEQNRIARFALLFHDTGKAAAEEVIERDDGTKYRRYGGHEQISGVTFAEYWVSAIPLHPFLKSGDARIVRFIIEHHLPYGLKNKQKLADLKASIACTGFEQTFYDCLISDCYGRISDDHDAKKQAVHEWIEEFKQIEPAAPRDSRGGTCYIMVGPSGSGKSTWIGENRKASDYMFSLDILRREFWHRHNEIGFAKIDEKKFYAEAFQFATENEKLFDQFVRETRERMFIDSFKSLKNQSFRNIFVDNTNGSKKARAPYIQLARQADMKVVAVEFWNTLETLAARQKTRKDKEVPYDPLRKQYFAQTSAMVGSEVDGVILVVGQ